MNLFITTQPLIILTNNNLASEYNKYINFWQDYWRYKNIFYNKIVHLPLSSIKYNNLDIQNTIREQSYDAMVFVSPHAIKSYVLAQQTLNSNLKLYAKNILLIGNESYKYFTHIFKHKLKYINIIYNSQEELQNSVELWNILIQKNLNLLNNLNKILIVKSNKGNSYLYEKFKQYNRNIIIDYIQTYTKNYINTDFNLLKLDYKQLLTNFNSTNNIANKLAVYISSSDILPIWQSQIKLLTDKKHTIYIKHQSILDKYINILDMNCTYKII